MMSNRIISYAQRFEDLHLLRCFGERSDGFYIDIGSGHPVYDNSSLLFYLRGWHGVTVEPNPALARLTRAVRTRDRHIEALVGASAGSATFYLVDDYHGLSTMIEDYARSALREFAKTSQALSVPVTTLRDICEEHAPPAFDFLKVDFVETAKDRPAGFEAEPVWRRSGNEFASLSVSVVAEPIDELSRLFRRNSLGE